MPTVSEFLDKDYVDPNESKYFRPQDGLSKVRLLTAPLQMWVEWIEEDGKRRPIRYERDAKPKEPHPNNSNIPQGYQPFAFAWAVVIWNHETGRCEVWEITQGGIRNRIAWLNNHRGNPLDYDIEIFREGAGKNTSYTIEKLDKEPLPQNVQDTIGEELAQIDLSALLRGENPFGQGEDIPF